MAPLVPPLVATPLSVDNSSLSSDHKLCTQKVFPLVFLLMHNGKLSPVSQCLQRQQLRQSEIQAAVNKVFLCMNHFIHYKRYFCVVLEIYIALFS